MSNAMIKNHDIGDLYFGQLHPMHQAFFDGLYGQHTRIKVRDLPHYAFWRDEEWLKPKNSLYCQYLKESWEHYQPDKNSKRDRLAKIEEYIKLKNDILDSGIKEPVIIVEALDDSKVIVSGNHRASIAYHIGVDLPYETLGLKDYIEQQVRNQDEFYGTKNRGIPYQSIYYKERELVKGRRQDTLERFKKMDIMTDIRGKSVLDVGANIGVNALLAWQFGAKEVLAVEYSPRISRAALRLSTLFDSRISVLVHDMGKKMSGRKTYDTVFCFSLYKHVGNQRQLEKNLVRKTSKVLYFEGHENAKQEDYEHIFNNFSTVQFLGYNKDGIHSKKSTRPFFRCLK